MTEVKYRIVEDAPRPFIKRRNLRPVWEAVKAGHTVLIASDEIAKGESWPGGHRTWLKSKGWRLRTKRTEDGLLVWAERIEG